MPTTDQPICLVWQTTWTACGRGFFSAPADANATMDKGAATCPACRKKARLPPPAPPPTLADFRALVTAGIAKMRDEQGEGGKRYEGQIKAEAYLPSIHNPEIDDPASASLTLHCYLLGPSRHYKWTAPTLEQALQVAIEDVETWVAAIDDDDVVEQFRGENVGQVASFTLTSPIDED